MAVLSGLLLVAAISFYAGVAYNRQRSERLEGQAGTLDTQIRLLQQRKSALLRRVARIQRDSRMDTYATGKLQRMLQQREVRIAKLSKQLAFYHSLLAPGKKPGGFEVRNVHLTPDHGCQYAYRLVLTRVNGGRGALKGKVQLRIAGTQDGDSKRLSLARLDGDSGDDTDFSFRYFQRLSGVFRLPKGFEPTQFIVSVVFDDHRAPVDHSYPWATIVTRNQDRQCGAEREHRASIH